MAVGQVSGRSGRRGEVAAPGPSGCGAPQRQGRTNQPPRGRRARPAPGEADGRRHRRPDPGRLSRRRGGRRHRDVPPLGRTRGLHWTSVSRTESGGHRAFHATVTWLQWAIGPRPARRQPGRCARKAPSPSPMSTCVSRSAATALWRRPDVQHGPASTEDRGHAVERRADSPLPRRIAGVSAGGVRATGSTPVSARPAIFWSSARGQTAPVSAFFRVTGLPVRA